MDYYEILGLKSNDVSDIEIKKAYKKKALENHPDKGGNEEEFKKISVAFDILGDVENRKKYDNDKLGNNFDLSFDFGNFNSFNSFNDLNFTKIKKNDHIYELKVSLKNIYFGITKSLKITIKSICLECKNICEICNGHGVIIQLHNFGPFSIPNKVLCKCDSGFIININKNMDCECDNYIITKEKNIEIKIDNTIKNNDNIIFKGLGEQISNGNEIVGDFIIKCIIEKDCYFERINNDLIYKYKLTFVESIVGKCVIIPHYAGDININTDIFGIIDPNKKYYLKNKGLDNNSNLILVFDIIYYEKFSENEKKLLLIYIDKGVSLT